ncbi:MAG: hypothetical protein JSV91_06495 [Phycisphaerales bacterium]|nr:MAG: hypothetical protein JSV91_06495 [Phycisphaerales bacterium]
MERIHEKHRSIVALIGLAAAGALALSASASGQLLDDFEDGNDDGWYRFYYGDGIEPGWAVVDANTKVYRLWATDTEPSPPLTRVGSYLEITEDPSFSNGHWWTTVVRENENTDFFLVMRGDLATLSGYGYGWSWEDELNIIRVAYGEVQAVLASTPFDMEVGEEYIVEAGALRDHLELRMWPVGEDRPDLPQVEATGPEFASGVNAVLARSNHAGYFSATFDNVSFSDVCMSDITGDGTVNVKDLLRVVHAFGSCDDCPEDVNLDGLVDVDDLLEVVHNFGPCP